MSEQRKEPEFLRGTFLDPVLIAFVLASIGLAVWGVYRTAAVSDAAALRRGRNGLRNADRAFAHGAAAAPDARLAKPRSTDGVGGVS